MTVKIKKSGNIRWAPASAARSFGRDAQFCELDRGLGFSRNFNTTSAQPAPANPSTDEVLQAELREWEAASDEDYLSFNESLDGET